MQSVRVKALHYVSNWTVEEVFCLFPFAAAVSESQLDDQAHRVQSLLSAGAAELLGSSLRKRQPLNSLKAEVHFAGSSSSWPSSCLMWMARTLLHIHCLLPTRSLVHHIRTLHKCYPHTSTLVQWGTSPCSRSTANPMWSLVPIRLQQLALPVERQRVGRPVWRPSWRVDVLPGAGSLHSEEGEARIAEALGWAVPSKGYPSSSACSVEAPSSPSPCVPFPSSGSLLPSEDSYPS